MKTLHLKQHLYFRHLIKGRHLEYPEAEINILIAIFILNSSAVSCSRNTLYKYLSEISRMPNRKLYFATIKKLKGEAMIRIFGTQIYLTLTGKQFLFALDMELSKLGYIESSTPS